MTADEDFAVLAGALRSAATSGTAAASRPGYLRLKLEASLGAGEATRLRREIHQVVVAAEENLPANLTRIAPLTKESLHRLGSELSNARGWNPHTGQRVTMLWAAALGFDELVASSWPPEESSRPQVESQAGAPPVLPTLAPQRDDRWPAPGSSSAAPAHGASAANGAEPRPKEAADPGDPAAAWPRTSRSLAMWVDGTAGENGFSVIRAYAGMSLTLFTGLMVLLVVVLSLPILIYGANGALLPILGVVVAKLLVSRLGNGALVASAGGVDFIPYDGAMARPRPEQRVSAPWSAVRIEPGLVSSVFLGERRVQVGPRNRAFVTAAQRHLAEA